MMKKRLTAMLLTALLVFATVFTAAPGAAAAEIPEVSAESAQTLTINQAALRLGIGEKYTLRVTGASSALSWNSSSGSVTVAAGTDNSAQLTAKSKGNAVITATAKDGARITCRVSVLPLAEKLTLNKTSLTLGIGEEYDLDSYVPEGSEAYYRMYSSSNSAVAPVAASGGIVKAKAAGTANIYCTLDNGVEAKCVVTVLPMAQSLSLNYSKLTLKVGEQADLDSYVPGGYAAYFRDYEADNTDVVSVTKAGGIVTALSAGTSNIYCKLRTGAEAVCEVSVVSDELPTEPATEAETESLIPAEPATEAEPQTATEPDTAPAADDNFALGKSVLVLGEGEEFTILTSGAGSAVTWFADSAAVSITDNNDGTAVIKANSAGKATVAAVTLAGSEAACVVTVLPMADSLTLNKTSLTLGIGEEYDLDSYVPKGTEAYFRAYSSSDPAVAPVAASGGIVKAISAGTAEIYCTLQNGVEARCVVTVLPMAESLSLNKTSLTLGIGEEYDLDSYVPKGSAAYFRAYSTSKPSVASVTASGGIVKAKAAGTANIYCTLENGVEAKCVVTVLPMAKSLTLNKTSLTLGVGEEYDLDSYVPKGSAAYFRTYSSSKTSVAAVAASGGIVKAKSAGTADIYCTLPNGVKTKCVVTVKSMAQSLTLNKTRVRLRIGGKFDLDSTVPSGTAAYFRDYFSNDASIAKVTKSNGIVTGVAEGNTTVYCKLRNGKTAACEIQVMSAADSLSEKNGIIVNYHGHDNYSGEDVWGKGTLEASVVDWMTGNWACCSYFEGNAQWRCAEWGRYVRNTRAASQSTTDYSNLQMTPANIRKIAKGCKPGTTMSFGPQYVPSHMIVLLRVTDDHIWWADCNWNWDNRIHYREATLEEFVNFVHWLPTPAKNGYIVSITKVNKLNTFDKPVTNAARYLNRGDARIVWTKVNGAESYEVYQVTGSGDKLVSTQTSTSYTNTDSAPGKKYTYYVKAVMSSGKKVTGNKVSVNGRIDCPLLEIDRANKCIKWNPVEGASGYKIYRRSGISGSFKEIKTIKGTSYKDSVMNFKAGEYDNSSYRIQAISSKGESASSVWSDIVAVSQEYCMP